MVSTQNRAVLYVTFPIYFCLLIGATFWAYRKMANLKRNETADTLSAHYIGGRDFGPWLMCGTLFASMYSGYTVVGIPNEAYAYGWIALRWMPTFASIVTGLIGTSFRLRRISSFRNHQSPVDFITDRFQSQVLRYTVVTLQIMTTIIFLAAQVTAIKLTFNSMFGIDPNNVYPVIIIMFVTLIFECIGGLNSVALTDSIQAVIMLFAFTSIPIIMVVNFGGWRDLTPSTYPQPTFYQTISQDAQVNFWQFSFINFAFFTLPHFIQRIYAVKDLSSLKLGYAVLTVGPWIAGFVGVFIGTVGVTLLVDETTNEPLPDISDPFTSILEKVMDLGGIAKWCAAIAITASLAAIMSTADSLIIAISQLIVVEIIYPAIPNTPPSRMAWYGRMSSLFAVTCSCIIGLVWEEGVSDLGKIQFPLTMQVVPPFLIGLFAYNQFVDAHPWCIASSTILSSLFVIGIYFGYLKHPSMDPVAMDPGIVGVIMQFGLIAFFESSYRLITNKGLFLERNNKRDSDTVEGHRGIDKNAIMENSNELLYSDRPAWDVPPMNRFCGDVLTLTPQLVWKSMDGFFEPLTNIYWMVLMFVALSMCTPLVPQYEPPYVSGEGFLYPPVIVNGLPWWAFKIILLVLIPFLLLIYAIYQIPNAFPMDSDNELKLRTEGISNVNLLPLTQKEMGKRLSYDETNPLIYRRRATISNTMEQMGISAAAKSATMALQPPTLNQKRLRNLVTGHDSSVIVPEASSSNDGSMDC